MERITPRLRGLGISVFAEMTRLAQQHQAVNLGQGTPDFDGPDHVKAAACEAIQAGYNQYATSHGVQSLRMAIAAHQRRFYGLCYDPEHEVTVLCGATEAIAATILSLCGNGDEVLLLEPYYDAYPAGAALAGATVRSQRLAMPEGGLDRAALEAAVGPRTKALILNNPHNPLGKVFTREELQLVADLCQRHDLIAVADEVYEHIVYEGVHLPLASLPGMRERTVSISSAAKTFSLTGWKVGWACAPPALTQALRCAHQFLSFATPAPLQLAIALALDADDAFYQQLRSDYRCRRDRLLAGLRSAGLEARAPAGAYFICADVRRLGFTSDVEFCRRLIETVGVAAIPNSAFCKSNAEPFWVRFAFCKSDGVLDEAVGRLTSRASQLAH